MSKERRSTHIRVSYSDLELVERVKERLHEKYPERKTIPQGEAVTYALRFTLGMEDEEKTEKGMVDIFP